METIANVVLSFFELVEAEGRVMRKNVVVLMECFLFMFLGVLLLFIGVIALSYALYACLSTLFGTIIAAFVIAASVLASGFVMLTKARARSSSVLSKQEEVAKGGVSLE